MTPTDTEQRATFDSFAYVGLAAILVVLFIPTIGIWQLLSAKFGSTISLLIPVVAVAGLLSILLLFRMRARRELPFAWPYIVVAIVLCGIALMMSDPRFPAKRIHVAEYVLVAIVVRRAFCRWTSGTKLIVITAVVSVLFGIHDELIQGLHPKRTFGLRDIAVDGCSAIAGALAGHGLLLNERIEKASSVWPMPNMWSIAAIVLGLGLMLGPLPAFREVNTPWWIITPMLAAGFIWHMLERAPRRWGDPATIAAWMAFVSVTYPVLTHVSPLLFR